MFCTTHSRMSYTCIINKSLLVLVLWLLFATTLIAGTRFFPDTSVWYEDISAAPLDAQSSSIISSLQSMGGWGKCTSPQVACGKFQVDLSIRVLYATPGTPTKPVIKRADGVNDYYSPDCDIPPGTTIPLPTTGGIEGQSGSNAYTCDYNNNDCHLIVVDNANKKIYESYLTTVDAAGVHSTCVVIWDMCQDYPKTLGLRGDQCTSADAAGFPISQLLFTPDEIKNGTIDHAIRFILPNYKIRNNTFVHPASHATRATTSTSSVIYGNRLRLKSSVDISFLSSSAQVVARALKKYGMFLSDGGNIPLTAADDQDFTTKWADVGFTSQSLFGLNATDFEVVDGGNRITLTFNCNLNTLTPTGCTGSTTPSATTTNPSSTTPSSTATTPSGSSTTPGSTTTKPGATTQNPGSSTAISLIAVTSYMVLLAVIINLL